jgi:uncharacterized protein YbcI
MELATKAAVEQDVLEGVARYHREQQGRAPAEIECQLLRDMLIVRSRGIFTPTEQELLRLPEGRKLVSTARRELRSLTRDDAEANVARAAGCEVLRSYYDLDVRIGEQVEVYMLAENLQSRLSP